ncbi:hypothetical protein Tco_1318432 [Tanacetum coccineum]
MMIVDIEESRHGPSDAMHNPSQPFEFLSKILKTTIMDPVMHPQPSAISGPTHFLEILPEHLSGILKYSHVSEDGKSCLSQTSNKALGRLVTSMEHVGQEHKLDQEVIKMLQVKEMMQDNDHKNSKSKRIKAQIIRSQSYDEQSYLQQDKTKTKARHKRQTFLYLPM